MKEIKVLCIDDEPRAESDVIASLRARGFEVVMTSSGEKGLNALTRQDFHVVLCDLTMPQMDGLEVLTRIKEIKPGLPVILMTSRGTVELAVQAIRQGAYDFVLKPAEVNKIETTIHKAIEHSRLQFRLSQSESHSRLLQETIPDLIYSLDSAGNFITLGPAVKNLLGYEPQELIGTSVFILVHPEDRQGLREGFEYSMRTGDSEIKKVEFRMVDRQGRTRFFEVNRRLIFENSKVIRQDGIARDVTERKALEQRLQLHSEQLELKVHERTEKLEYANRQLAALNHATGRFSQMHDEEELLNEIPAILTRTLDFDRATLLLEERGRLTLRAYCMDKDKPAVVQHFLKAVHSPDFKVPPHFLECFEQNRTIFVPDLNADPRWPREPDRPIRTKAVVMAPIRANKKPIGVVVGNMQHHERAMDPQDVERFEMFANMVGLALDNIRAYRSLERKVIQRTKSLKQANRALSAQTRELEQRTYSLGRANVQLLRVQEELEKKNSEMEQLFNVATDSNKRLQAILDASLSAIVMVDNTGNIISSNRRVHSFFCLEMEDILNEDFDTFLTFIKGCFKEPKKFLAYTKDLKKSASVPEALEEYETLISNALELDTAQQRFITIFSIPVQDQAGQELGRVWLYNDITKIKLADEQLRSTLEASPVPFLVSRKHDGKILYANDKMLETVGVTREEIADDYTPDYYYNPDDRKEVLARVERDGFLKDYEVRVRRADGSSVWMIFSIVQSEMAGEPVFIGALYDINARKQAEEAVRQSEEKFRQLTENIKEAFWMVGLREDRMLYVSPSYADIFGRSTETLYDNPGEWLNAVHPDDRQHLTSNMESSQHSQNEQEFRIVWPDGTIRWIRSRAFPIRDEKGQVYRYCGVSEDITERVEAREALQRERNFVSTILDTAGALVLVLDMEGRIVRFNRACEVTSGYRFEDVRGRNLWDLFLMPSEVVKVRATFNELLRGDFPNYQENVWLTKDGQRRLIAWSNTALLNDDNETEFIIATGIDITERKEAEAKLQDSLRDIERANQELRETQLQLVQTEKMASLGMLVAGIAHEINTPIGAINSMHDTLKRAVVKLRETLVTDYSEAIASDRSLSNPIKIIQDANKVIDNGCERVTTIVRRLRSFARLDEAELKTVDIHEGIEDTLTLVHHEIKHSITVHKQFGKVPPIACYPGRLNQVYLNLLINAKQAIPTTGEVTIKTYHRSGKLYIRFADTGMGIPEKQLSKIFDPGFTTKGVGVGTGLGLSICYQIVQDHRGEIKVQSTVGKGTTFTIVLPMNLDELLEKEA